MKTTPKRLYYIALAKPRASACWTPMLISNKLGRVIIAKRKASCMTLAQAWLPVYVKDDCSHNRFNDPKDWHVKAAAVIIRGE